jgi:hypothetical protein
MPVARHADTGVPTPGQSPQRFQDVSRLVSFLPRALCIASIIALILDRYEIVPWWTLLLAIAIDLGNALGALALILTMAPEPRMQRSETEAHDAEQ